MERVTVFLIRYKEFIGTTTVVVCSLLLPSYLGEGSAASPLVQSFVTYVAIFLAVPLIYCKILLGRPLSLLGFQKGNVWAGIGGGALALSVALAALLVLWNFTPLLKDYRLPRLVEEKFFFFVLYEVGMNGFIALLYETYFRGFIMLLWLRHFGVWSVLLQATILFVLLYGNITAETIPLLLFAPFAGLIAYQSRSIWFSFGASWLFYFLTDVLMLIFR